MKNKWILFGVAFVIMAINLLNADFSAFSQLSPADFLPVIVIALVSFLIKTGVLSALVIGIKKLWERIKRKSVNRNCSRNSGFLPLDAPKIPMGVICNIFCFGCDTIAPQEVRR